MQSLPAFTDFHQSGEQTMPKAYCVPWNAGLASETPAVCRRIGRLLTALDTEIDSNIVQGEICKHIRDFRFELMTRLEAEGWTMSYDGGNRMKVRPPGHKRPFNKRVPTRPHFKPPSPFPPSRSQSPSGFA